MLVDRLIIETEQRIVKLEQIVERQPDKVVNTDQLLQTTHNATAVLRHSCIERQNDTVVDTHQLATTSRNDTAALHRSCAETAHNKRGESQLADLQDRDS